MAEMEEVGEKKVSAFVRGSKKPKDVPGSSWIRVKHPEKWNRTVGWSRVSGGEPPPFEDEPYHEHFMDAAGPARLDPGEEGVLPNIDDLPPADLEQEERAKAQQPSLLKEPEKP